MVGLTLLAVVITGLQVWWSQGPFWTAFKASLAALLCALVLGGIILGREFGWWYVDGETLDAIAMAWVGLTVLVAGLTYWLAH